MATEILTVKKIENALIKAGGLKTHAARLLGVHYQTIYTYFKKYPELNDIHAEILEISKDKAESVIFHHIEQKNLSAAIFFLKCKAKDRGYVERQEVTGRNGGAIESHSQIGVGLTMEQLNQRRAEVLESLKEIRMLKFGDKYIDAEEVNTKEKSKRKSIKRKRLTI